MHGPSYLWSELSVWGAFAKEVWIHIAHTPCMFNQTTGTQQSARKGRKEKHMQDTIFYTSCHWKILPINLRELYAKQHFTESEKQSELVYRAFPTGQGSKRKTSGFICAYSSGNAMLAVWDSVAGVWWPRVLQMVTERQPHLKGFF